VAVNRPLLALLAVALASALLSGCMSDTSGPAADAGDPSAAGAPQGSAAGSAATHGTPKRADGPVDVEPQGGQFVAKQVITITNDFGGASASKLGLSSFNGGVALGASRDGGYQFKAELYGRGATEDQARQALDLLELAAKDDLSGGTLTLAFTLTSGTVPSLLPLLGGAANNGGSFALLVPPQPGHEASVDTSNGGVSADGLHGPALKAATSNGGISVHGAFGELGLDTSNGGLDLEGTFNDVHAGTTNGGVDADLRFTHGGKVEIGTSNGGIDVRVPASGAAYDVGGDTSNGDVDIRLGGTHIRSDSHATYRSPDWSSSSLQVAIDLSTSNAGISVED
jgi:hypothetical protein